MVIASVMTSSVSCVRNLCRCTILCTLFLWLYWHWVSTGIRFIVCKRRNNANSLWSSMFARIGDSSERMTYVWALLLFRQTILYFSSLLELIVALVFALLTFPPVGQFTFNVCQVKLLSDFYPIFHNPVVNYRQKLRCSYEIVYPL